MCLYTMVEKRIEKNRVKKRALARFLFSSSFQNILHLEYSCKFEFSKTIKKQRCVSLRLLSLLFPLASRLFHYIYAVTASLSLPSYKSTCRSLAHTQKKHTNREKQNNQTQSSHNQLQFNFK